MDLRSNIHCQNKALGNREEEENLRTFRECI